MGVDLPEWWGARHARRMYNATTSTLAPHADPRGGFTVLDQEQRRLHNHAHALGFADLGSYLRARCRLGHCQLTARILDASGQPDDSFGVARIGDPGVPLSFRS